MRVAFDGGHQVIPGVCRCGARGSASQSRHSGGAGAPSGTTTGPCQELADDRSIATVGESGARSAEQTPPWRAERRPRVR